MGKKNFRSGKSSQKSINYSSSQAWSFVSAPDLHPMMVTINVNKPGTAPGFIFVAPYTSFGVTLIGQTGALIMDQAGDPVCLGRSITGLYKIRTLEYKRTMGNPFLPCGKERYPELS